MPQPSFYNLVAQDDPVRKDLAVVRTAVKQISALEVCVFSEYSSCSDLEQVREMLDQMRILSSRLREHCNLALNRIEEEIEEQQQAVRNNKEEDHAEA